jgi:hypothetical protein
MVSVACKSDNGTWVGRLEFISKERTGSDILIAVTVAARGRYFELTLARGVDGACAVIAIARGRNRASALPIAQRLKRSRYSTISATGKCVTNAIQAIPL